MHLDGALIPVKLLENGVSILQETAAEMRGERFTYFHVELETHDVLLAEGAPAESYLDTGNRAVFENSGGVFALHPDFTPRRWDSDAAAPLTVRGAPLQRVRERLLQRMEADGARLTEDADLHVVVDGRKIRPSFADGRRAQFVVPPHALEVRLVSRASVAAQVLSSAYDDRRRLGVAIDRIVLRHDGQLYPVALDNPSLAEGFHAAERAGARLWRWTDGDARLPPACYRQIQGAFILELGLWARLQYRVEREGVVPAAVVSRAA